MAVDAALRPLEHLTITSPYGVRFWDVAGRDFVRSGLALAVGEVDSPRALTIAQNGSGTWIVGGLRLKRPRAEFASDAAFRDSDDFRWGDGTQPFWDRWPTPVTTLELTVRDPESRFLPYRFRSPAPQRGFARRVCGEAPIDAMPLYPAPARRVPTGMAIVRAQLATLAWTSPPGDHQQRLPAAWAYVTVMIAGQAAGSSYADEQGRVAVMFPWPKPLDNSLSSPPPGSSGNALINQTWRVRLRAFYDGLPADTIPDLSRVLAQREVVLQEGLVNVPLGERELQFGRELVVRSGGAGSPPAANADVLIQP